ncbi:MAG: hypothetical protein RLY86_3632 [Pseudomonadota bacterium]|jgi:hypothetical protein
MSAFTLTSAGGSPALISAVSSAMAARSSAVQAVADGLATDQASPESVMAMQRADQKAQIAVAVTRKDMDLKKAMVDILI